MGEFRNHGHSWEFEKKLREAMKRARSSAEFHERFTRMARMVKHLEPAQSEHPIVKADLPFNWN
jgi:hypothetical protein